MPSASTTPATPSANPTASAAASPAALRFGSQGTAVLVLQQRLQNLGYWLPEATGTFDEATQQAVWALQKVAGVTRDGVVGPATQAALDAGTRPSAISTSGHVLEARIEDQILLAVDDGTVTMVLNASTGGGSTYTVGGVEYVPHTPTGSFATYREYDESRQSGRGLGAMWRPKFYDGNYAIHGADSVPPYPDSHGCVRVTNDAMDWIWDVWGAPLGTSVIVS